MSPTLAAVCSSTCSRPTRMCGRWESAAVWSPESERETVSISRMISSLCTPRSMTMRSMPACFRRRINSPIVSAARGTGMSPTTSSSPTMPTAIEGMAWCAVTSVSPSAVIARVTSGWPGAYSWVPRMAPASRLRSSSASRARSVAFTSSSCLQGEGWFRPVPWPRCGRRGSLSRSPRQGPPWPRASRCASAPTPRRAAARRS